MKKIILWLLTIYHTIISPMLHQVLGMKTACRRSPDCSVYAHMVIEKHGVWKGSLLALRRFVNCQPFFTI